MSAPVSPCGSSGGSSCTTARVSALLATARRPREPAPGAVMRSPLRQVKAYLVGRSLGCLGGFDQYQGSCPSGSVKLECGLVEHPCTWRSLPVVIRPRSSVCSEAARPTTLSLPDNLPVLSRGWMARDELLCSGVPWPFASAPPCPDPGSGRLAWNSGMCK